MIGIIQENLSQKLKLQSNLPKHLFAHSNDFLDLNGPCICAATSFPTEKKQKSRK
jgi:hypothetical protein